MHKHHKLWIILLVILVCLGVLLFWLAPSQSTAERTDAAQTLNAPPPTLTSSMPAPTDQSRALVSPSQQDTEVNCQLSLDNANRLIVNEQTRNCFEYFITQYGEKDLKQIKHDFKAYIQQNYKEPALGQIIDLWNRYINYREKLGELQPPNIDKEDPKYYQSIFAHMKNLRKQLFSDYEIEGLFGTEDTYHEYTLNRMTVLADKSLTEAQKAQKLKDLFNQLPEDWKENLEQLNKLEDLRKLTADIKARGGSAEDIHQMRMNLVGPEATQRLETLDKQRNDWKDKVNQYLAERDSIMKSGMSDEAKQQAVQKLRTQHFNKPQEQLRVGTFETIHDQGGKLPYTE